jgi:flagellar biosynthesis chaperone FliJ
MSIEEELGEIVATDERIEEEVEERKSEVMELARVLTSAMEYINREEGEIVEIRNALEKAREEGLDESEKDALIASVERVETEIDQTRSSIAGLRESFECDDLFSTMGMVEDKLESQIAVVEELQDELT